MNEDNDNKNFYLPKNIQINGLIYKYKDELINQNYTYRCKKRKNCGFVIKIKKQNQKSTYDNTYIIKYEVTGKTKEHQCIENTNTDKKDLEVKNKDINELKYEKYKIKILLVNSLDKPLSFHLMNLKNNNIILKPNHVKHLFQKYRELTYPSDTKFLIDISKIKITLDESNINTKDLSMCYSYNNIINIKKKINWKNLSFLRIPFN